MSRAQEIRQRRLNERQKIAEEQKKLELKTESEAKMLFDWVLDMFETPTNNNTADEVHLSETYYGKIQVGYNHKEGLTDKDFNWKVMKKLAEMFEAEEGYTGIYFAGQRPESDSYVTIKIKQKITLNGLLVEGDMYLQYGFHTLAKRHACRTLNSNTIAKKVAHLLEIGLSFIRLINM